MCLAVRIWETIHTAKVILELQRGERWSSCERGYDAPSREECTESLKAVFTMQY